MSEAQIFLSYDTLRILWWVLLGVLLTGFALLDGFDLGMAILLPYAARTDGERRVMLNTVGPVWEGNQVWFILGGGAIFAAWPLLYAAAFSGFYFAMFLVLASLIVRPVGFDYRSKVEDTRWRSAWDACLFLGGCVPALVFGVAFGNLFEGVPFTFDPFMRLAYSGTFFDLLNPFALLCGLVSLTMIAVHGAVFLVMKTEGAVAARARKAAMILPPFITVLVLAAAVWGKQLSGFIYDGNTVITLPGAWWNVYTRMPPAFILLALALLCPLLVSFCSWRGRQGMAFIASCVGIASIIANAGFALFPFLLPSSLDPVASLTVWNASSSHLTLFIMLIATAFFMPLIGCYTLWAYRKMRGRVTEETIKQHGHY